MDLNTNAYRVVGSLTKDNKGDKRSTSAREAGKIGGRARSTKLSAERRLEIASRANAARWARKKAG